MAFDPMQFSATNYANGWTMWHYRTEDSIKDILGDLFWGGGEAPNYFGGAAALVRSGDLIHINARHEGELECVSVWVYNNEKGVVVVEEA